MTHIRLLTLFFLLFIPSALLRGQWYVNYEKGRDAVKEGRWQQAVTRLTEALNDEPNSKARKKTYSLQFIDYFPYLYRGIAYYKLSDLPNARADLEKAKSEGAVEDANQDAEAPALLAEYIGLVEKTAAQIAQQKPPPSPQQKPAVTTQQNPPPATPQTDPKYAEGLRLFNQKEYRKALDQLTAVPGNSPQHAQAARLIERAQSELKKIETASDERAKKDRIDRSLAAGAEAFKRDDLDRAESEFKGVLELEARHRGAEDYLRRIQARRQKLAAAAAVHPKELPAPSSGQPAGSGTTRGTDTTGSALFTDAVALFHNGKIGRAKTEFQALQGIAPSYPELAKYTGLIVSVEEKVHLGIASFFRGEYNEAIDQLSSSAKIGNDNPHVYAFLASAYAAEYLLSGAENAGRKKEAVDAFGKAKTLDPRYELDPKLISPTIIALLTGE